MNSTNKLVTILGPTAVGKTKFAAHLAYKFEAEIISADSRQVYIGMDIGTGKDLEDYVVKEKKIEYHIVDVVKPECEFNLYLFTRLFKSSYNSILEKKKVPFLVGGTGMYISAIVHNYSLNEINFSSERANILEQKGISQLKEILKEINPRLHNTTDLIEKERIIRAILIAEDKLEGDEDLTQFDNLIIGLYDEREILKDRIRKRLKDRLNKGMIEEVEGLLIKGITHEKLRFFGLEYKYISMYLNGELNRNDMTQKLASKIIEFSKKQMTWFRKMEKEGIKIYWLKNNQFESAEELIKSFLL